MHALQTCQERVKNDKKTLTEVKVFCNTLKEKLSRINRLSYEFPDLQSENHASRHMDGPPQKKIGV